MIDNVFILNPDGTVEFDPAIRNGEVFKKLIVNSRKSDNGKLFDSGKTARIANEKITYAFLMTSPSSLYFYNYRQDDGERSRKVIQFIGVKDWKIDKDVNDLVNYFEEELNQVITFSLINNALKSAFATADYFGEVDYKKRDAKQNLMYDPKDVMSSLKSLGEVIDGLEELLKRYRRDGVAKKEKMRGKKSKSPLELPPNQRR